MRARQAHERPRHRLRRGVLTAVAVLAVLVVAAVTVMHTAWGREIIRARIQRQLQTAFTGGGSLGRIEGSPLGKLTLHDLVINGPDRQPAISVKKTTIEVGILPLLSHQLRVVGLTAEDVDVDLRRDDHGDLQIKRLMRPSEKSTWSVALPKVEVRRGHVRFDTGTQQMGQQQMGQMMGQMMGQIMNLDGLALDARATMPHGGPVETSLVLRGTWRERAAASLDLQAAVHSDERGLTLPHVSVRAGEVSVRGDRVTIAKAEPGHGPPIITGTVTALAPAAAVARLFPDVQLPADIAVTVTATQVTGRQQTELAIAGRIDQTAVRIAGTVDVPARHAWGEAATGTLDVTKLTGGKLSGSALANVTFDVRPGGPRALPVAAATIHGWGEVAGVPKTMFQIALRSAGERARAVVDVTGDRVQVNLAANLRAVGDLFAIEQATLRAKASNLAYASGGKAPVHGTLEADLTASGTLRPAPSLAVTGKIEGRHLRMQDLSVAALHLAIDAQRLPNRPLGRARVQLVDLVRSDMQLGELTLEAADRADGKVAVSVRSRPKQNPWLIDADALVTPPSGAGAGTVAIDILRHRVRAGSGTDWTGRTGHLEIGPRRIVLRDLVSQSPDGAITIAGSYERTGRRRGELAANLDVTRLALDNVSSVCRGTLDAHVAVTRRGRVWQGEVQLDAAGIAIERTAPAIDAHMHAALRDETLTVAADAQSPELGSARLALDLEPPRTITDPGAWKRLGQGAIRTAELTLQGIHVGRAAALAGLRGEYGGRVDGAVRASASTMSGRMAAAAVVAPALRGAGPVGVVVNVAQTTPTELTPNLVATVDGIGTVSAQARLAIPDRLFDPAAWTRLGRAALRGATVRTDDIPVDPALLARFGISSDVRGRASVAVELGPAGRTLQGTIDLAELRGATIHKPIDVHLATAIDDRATTSSLTVKTRTKGAVLVTADAHVPESILPLLARPQALRAMPLTGTATLGSVDAPELLAVFGRTEVIAGRVDGSIKLGGTLGAPTATATMIATGLKVPPGPRGKPVRTVERLAFNANWDGSAGTLAIDGVEADGGRLQVSLAGRPAALRDAKLAIKATKFDLVPILAFVPGPAGGAAGQLDTTLAVTGLDPRTAQIAGELHVQDARVPIAPSVGTLRQAKIDAVIADREIKLVIDGKLGAGTANVTGSIALDGAAPSGGKAKIALRKVSPIGAVEPQITADITATLMRDRNRNLWHADLVVDHGTVIVPSTRGETLKPVGAPADMVFADGARSGAGSMAHEAPARPIFLVTMGVRSMRVESDEFRGLIRGQVEIRADGQAIGMFGGVEADRGDLELFGRRYAVERAGVHFDGSLDPLLNVRISHEFPEVVTVAEVRGRASKPELIMSSDPSTYSQAQLLGFLLGGEPGGDPQSGAATSKVANAGASFVANQISGYVRKSLPIDIDVLRYESATASSSAAVTVGTWLTHALFLAYRQHLSARPDENTGEGEMEYWLSKRVVIEGVVGNRGYNGADLLWRKRY
jgi:hypothetical protein